MLEQKDLEAIRGIMREEIESSESVIIKELDRVQTNLEKQVNELKRNMEELQQYYRITKLENDNTAILLRMVEELTKRIDELEKKTA
ncbi:hypothetical protein [Ruminococcus gauvreauii]|uniref:hypothetical protein n=1 Tax=Ruminococcus gauvreauii TaxID=438033 RepID=UPI003983DDAA